eukprot:tig00021276_g19896.t1
MTQDAHHPPHGAGGHSSFGAGGHGAAGSPPPPPPRENPFVKAFQRARRFAVGGLAVVGGIVVLGAAVAASAKEEQRKRIVNGTVLTLDMERGLVETQPRSPLQAIVPPSKRPLILREVLDALEHAERDPRVRGLVLRVGGPSVGFAVAQELCDAVRSFSRAPSNKFSIAFAETFGELQNGNEAYVLASSCSEVHVQPSGDVTLGGLATVPGILKGPPPRSASLPLSPVPCPLLRILRPTLPPAPCPTSRPYPSLPSAGRDAPFVKGLLDRLGVAARIEAREEPQGPGPRAPRSRSSKPANAPNVYTETAFTAHHREATEHLLGRLHAQVRERAHALAAVGGLLPKDVKLVPVDRYYKAAVGPAEEAVKKRETRLRCGHIRAYKAHIRRAAQAATGKTRADGLPSAPTIALVYAVGNIMRGRNRERGLGPDENCWSDVVVSALRDAGEDEDVKAVVMRVDSRGGSAVASDTIGREATRVRDAGKPLVVSMGNYAASGGYWISMNATRILAWPGTITGSIGVFGGKALVRGAAEKLGVTFDWAGAGGESSARFSSPFWDYDAHGRERLAAFLDRIYGDFVRGVAAGRKLPFERALEVAKGRVWTGDDALQLGLVDEMGGLRAAIRAAKVAAGIPADAPVVVREFGPGARRTLTESLARFFKEEDDDVVSPAAEAGALSAAAEAAAEILEVAGLARAALDVTGLRPVLGQARLAELRSLEGGAAAHAGPAPVPLNPRDGR